MDPVVGPISTLLSACSVAGRAADLLGRGSAQLHCWTMRRKALAYRPTPLRWGTKGKAGKGKGVERTRKRENRSASMTHVYPFNDPKRAVQPGEQGGVCVAQK